MNPNYYNPCNNTNPNVGAGWSSNCNQFPPQNYGYGQAPPQNYGYGQAPPQNYGYGPTASNYGGELAQPQNIGQPPPPIGFVIPNSNQQNNYPQNQMNQPTQHHIPTNTIPQATNNIKGPNQPNSGNYQTAQNIGIHQNNNNSTNQTNERTYKTIQTSNNPHAAKQSTEQPKNANAQRVEPKSDYQKGLDKLAELMDGDVDLNPREMDKMRKNYDLSK